MDESNDKFNDTSFRPSKKFSIIIQVAAWNVSRKGIVIFCYPSIQEFFAQSENSRGYSLEDKWNK